MGGAQMGERAERNLSRVKIETKKNTKSLQRGLQIFIHASTNKGIKVAGNFCAEMNQ